MESPVSERPGPEEQPPLQVQAVHFQVDAMQTHDVPALSTPRFIPISMDSISKNTPVLCGLLPVFCLCFLSFRLTAVWVSFQMNAKLPMTHN